MKLKQWSLLAALTVTLPLAACGGDDGASSTSDAPASSDAPVSTDSASTGEGGSVFVTGSSTVEPISIKVGELAGTEEGGNLKVTVEGPGTGDGFKKFCAGDGDITGASRAIKEEEEAMCVEGGVERPVWPTPPSNVLTTLLCTHWLDLSPKVSRVGQTPTPLLANWDRHLQPCPMLL
jgi:ABC-type phosphate transport system substrate-binding protein